MRFRVGDWLAWVFILSTWLACVQPWGWLSLYSWVVGSLIWVGFWLGFVVLVIVYLVLHEVILGRRQRWREQL